MNLLKMPLGEYRTLMKEIVFFVDTYWFTLEDKIISSRNRYPTLREVAREFKITQKNVETIIEDCEQLGLIVGYRVWSGGTAEFKGGDRQVEAMV